MSMYLLDLTPDIIISNALAIFASTYKLIDDVRCHSTYDVWILQGLLLNNISLKDFCSDFRMSIKK